MNNFQIMRKPLRNLLLVNWSRFGAQKIKIEGSTLFTGVNGSGKSTLLDAMTYLISGNTNFNIAAQDKDRTVLGYVRGDTKSNGEYRYLRKGEIVSYIAMEFDSPTDRSHFVVGVCIESRDEKTFKSWWFVRNHASLDDFNFYEKDGTRLSVTPHNLLSCKKEKMRSQDFMPKEQGVKQVLRMMGLRCDWKEYRSKLIKMMAFKQENHIDHFIRDCVLSEHPIATLPHLQEQKKKYTELLITYEKLLKQKEQLNVVEEETVRFESVQRNVFLKWMVYYYQNRQTSDRTLKQLQDKLKQTMQQLDRCKAAEKYAKDLFDAAAQARSDAQKQYDDSDLNGSARSLAEQIQNIKREIEENQNKLNDICQLQGELQKLFNNQILGITPANSVVANGLCNPDISAEEKYDTLHDIQNKISDQTENFMHTTWKLNEELTQKELELSDIENAIKALESHQRTYPAFVEEARRILQDGLAKQGIHTEVRTFAELVEQITIPQWRDALEAYLRERRYHLLVEPEYAKPAMKIFHQNRINRAQLVMSDKLPDRKPDHGSAAEILQIPNLAARRYADYLLGRMHLCETLEELHEHPLGGIMIDGTLAKSYAMRTLEMQNIHYYLGADAITLELEVKQRERAELQNEIKRINVQITDYQSRLSSFSALNLDGTRYDFSAVERLPELQIQLPKFEIELEEIQKNPTLMALSDALDQANKKYNKALSERDEAIRETTNCCNKISSLNTSIEKAESEVRKAHDIYHTYELLHLELKREAIAEYEKQSIRKSDGIVITEKTIKNLEAELDRAQKTMENAQLEYCRLAGLDMEKRGISYIPFFRQQREQTSNVQAEEASTKLSEAQKQLESAFMNECVAELIEAIRSAHDEINRINNELKNLPFGNDIYSFTVKDKSDKAAFFRIMKRVNAQNFDADVYFDANMGDPELEHDIQEFMERILDDCDDTEMTDYRSYMHYDMEIVNSLDKQETSTLSEKQGSASNGEKQTPYLIILAASLMQCYPRNNCCARLVFIDEAFSALSSERIERMVHYFEQNGFQVMYAAPPEKINSIGRYINSTVSLIESGRYTFAVEGLVDEYAEIATKHDAEENTQLTFTSL